MEISNFLILILFSGIVGTGIVWLYPYQRSNPAFWFLIFQWIIAAGTIWLLDLSRPSDITYALMLILAVSSFLCGAFVAVRTFGLRFVYGHFWSRPIEVDPKITRFIITSLVALSVLVTIAYYRAVGYNLFIDIALGRYISDIVAARLNAYAGDQYYAPGYVNQFKNVLLPLGLSVMGAWALRARRWPKLRLWLIVSLGVPLVLYALLGAGQRGFLIYAFAAFFFGLTTIIRIRIARMGIVLAMVIGLFGVMSFFLGRIQEFTIGSVFLEFLSRLFQQEQESGLAGFRYVYEFDVVWFAEWWTGFQGLSPWHRGSDLDSQIFALIHGSTRGTATIATVGSVFHNAGLVGIIGVYAAMGWGYIALYRRFLSGRRTILRCFAYGALFFYLAFFVAGAPVALVNKGVVTLAIVLAIRKLRFVTYTVSEPRAAMYSHAGQISGR